MSWLDWIAVGLAVFMAAAFAGAVFLYLRTAYRKGGWPDVKASAAIAVFALVAFYVVRVAENSELGLLKEAVKRLTR